MHVSSTTLDLLVCMADFVLWLELLYCCCRFTMLCQNMLAALVEASGVCLAVNLLTQMRRDCFLAAMIVSCVCGTPVAETAQRAAAVLRLL